MKESTLKSGVNRRIKALHFLKIVASKVACKCTKMDYHRISIGVFDGQFHEKSWH